MKREITGAQLKRKLSRFTYHDYWDVRQEMDLYKLQYPTVSLRVRYAHAVRKLYGAKTFSGIGFKDIQQAYYEHLTNTGKRAEKLYRVLCRLYRIADPRLRDIGTAFLFSGSTHEQIAYMYHLSRPRVTMLLKEFARGLR